MGTSPVTSSEIVESVLSNKPLSADGVPLAVFRDAFNQMKGSEAHKRVIWILTIVEDQVIAQPVGREDISLILREPKPKYYTKNDFVFINADEFAIYGTTEGKYTFISFLHDVFTWRRIVLGIVVWLAGLWVANKYLTAEIAKTLSEALISSMSIFISIFVLFVLTVNPEAQYRVAEGDRFHRLVQSDKYIAFIGVITLLITIVGLTVSSAFANMSCDMLFYSWVKAGQASCLSTAVVGTISSFWLVLKYHFGRRNEMMEIMMAKMIIENQQRLFRKSLEKDKE
ncbi:MAG: hypothetical protein M0R70_10820 [Nitrospirae bacterium]|nr:hypothetical protein [Nitrospirota bacterium]